LFLNPEDPVDPVVKALLTLEAVSPAVFAAASFCSAFCKSAEAVLILFWASAIDALGERVDPAVEDPVGPADDDPPVGPAEEGPVDPPVDEAPPVGP